MVPLPLLDRKEATIVSGRNLFVSSLRFLHEAGHFSAPPFCSTRNRPRNTVSGKTTKDLEAGRRL
jgi:hypothetical protein